MQGGRAYTPACTRALGGGALVASRTSCIQLQHRTSIKVGSRPLLALGWAAGEWAAGGVWRSVLLLRRCMALHAWMHAPAQQGGGASCSRDAVGQQLEVFKQCRLLLLPRCKG